MSKKSEEDRLEKLLRLKRLEKPSEDEWLEFDRAFKDRMLSAVRDPDPWLRRVFSSVATIFNFKRAICALGVAALLLIVASMVGRRAGSLPDGQRLAEEVAREYVKFANDRLLPGGDGDVRSDVHTIGYAYDGVEYVQDMIPLQGVSSKFASM